MFVTLAARNYLTQAKHRGPTKAEMAGYKEVMKIILDDSRVTPQEVREMVEARKRQVARNDNSANRNRSSIPTVHDLDVSGQMALFLICTYEL